MTYTYEREGGMYRITKNGKPLNTPNGAAVVTGEEKLVKALVNELNAGKKHTDCTALLCYHFTYCDLAKQYSQQNIAKDICTYCKNNIDTDEWLMFLQTSKQEQVVQYFKKHLPNLIRQYNMYQLIAIMVIIVSFDSLLLSHHFINEVIIKLSTTDADYANLRGELLQKISSYLCTTAGVEPDDTELTAYVRLIGNTIDVFTTYFTL